MNLVLPCKKYEKEYYELVNSAIKNEDVSEMGNAYRSGECYQDMLKRLKNRRNGIGISNRDVPATVYFIIDNHKVVGTIDLRHKLNDNYFSRLGHVAYYIKPEERKKGYATKALSLALKKYKKHKIKDILITCLEDNDASRKVIEKNGGKLEKTFYDDVTKKYIQRFWINIIDDEKVIPNTVWLTTNMTCNNNCKWCYAKKYLKINRNMSYQNVKKYVSYLRNIGIKKIILIGGEPSIHPDILKIIRYISRNNIKVSMATNGRKFEDVEFCKKAYEAGLYSINISIKGSNEEEYMMNTNSNGFLQTIKGYENANYYGIKTSLSYVLCNTDTKKFDNFWEVVKEHHLNNILFQLYKPSAEDEKQIISIKELSLLCKYVYDKIYKNEINFVFEMSIPLCSLDKNMLTHMILKNRIITCCHIAKGAGMIFDSDFNILPCNHFMGHPLNDTKIKLDELVEFWNSNNAKQFRKIIGKYPSEICSRCKKWYQCGGGCAIRWLSSNPSEAINDKYVYTKEVRK